MRKNVVNLNVRYSFGSDSLNERDVLAGFMNQLSEERRKEVLETGLSVLDLKILAESFGYKVYAVTLKKASLFQIDQPVLVYLETPEYKHFSILRGVKEGTVFLADPSTGKTRMPLDTFLGRWKSLLRFSTHNVQFICQFRNKSFHTQAPNSKTHNSDNN